MSDQWDNQKPGMFQSWGAALAALVVFCGLALFVSVVATIVIVLWKVALG
jgi:hypothetical protein